MNVSQENISNVSAVIKVTIAKADFEPAVEKTLRGYRQKANIPGFRDRKSTRLNSSNIQKTRMPASA